MVSDSLCLTSFIKVESYVSLVVIGQRPHWGKRGLGLGLGKLSFYPIKSYCLYGRGKHNVNPMERGTNNTFFFLLDELGCTVQFFSTDT